MRILIPFLIAISVVLPAANAAKLPVPFSPEPAKADEGCGRDLRAGAAVPFAEFAGLRDFRVDWFRLTFKNEAYEYKIAQRPNGEYFIDAFFAGQPVGLDALEHWQPPQRNSRIELLSARENSAFQIFTFKISEQAFREWDNSEPHLVVWKCYGVIISKSPGKKSVVVRFELNAATGLIMDATSSVFYGDSRQEIGEVLSFDYSR